MTGRVHGVAGVAAAVLLASVLPGETPARLTDLTVYLVAAASGALVPDLDTPGSMIARALGPLRFVLWMVLRLIGVGHRGATHSLVGLAAASAAIAALGGALLPPALVPRIVAGFAVGYASHLVLDAMTVRGVPLWLPVSSRRVHLLPHGVRWRTRGR